MNKLMESRVYTSDGGCQLMFDEITGQAEACVCTHGKQIQ